MNIQEIASASALIKRELAPLAEKIGEGVEYTFNLFIKQVYVNAIMFSIFPIVFSVMCFYFGVKYSHKKSDIEIGIKFRKRKNRECPDCETDYSSTKPCCLECYERRLGKKKIEEDSNQFTGIVLIIFGIFLSCVTIMIFIPVLINPEYQAIKLIIGTFKPSN